jgi:hypothetical protein
MRICERKYGAAGKWRVKYWSTSIREGGGRGGASRHLILEQINPPLALMHAVYVGLVSFEIEVDLWTKIGFPCVHLVHLEQYKIKASLITTKCWIVSTFVL